MSEEVSIEQLPLELLRYVARHVGEHGPHLLTALSKTLRSRLFGSCVSLHVVQQPGDSLDRIVHRVLRSASAEAAGVGAQQMEGSSSNNVLPRLDRLCVLFNDREDSLQPLAELARAAPCLRHVTLACDDNTTDEDLEDRAMMTSSVKHKRNILSKCALNVSSWRNMDALGSMTSVEDVALSGFGYGSDMCMYALSCMKSVRELTLRRVPTDHPIYAKLAALPRLRSLRLVKLMPRLHPLETLFDSLTPLRDLQDLEVSTWQNEFCVSRLFSCLSVMTGLRSLCLTGVAASEEDPHMLSSLQQLESLTLEIFPLSSAYVASTLASVGSIKCLRVLNISVTDPGCDSTVRTDSSVTIDIGPLVCCTNLHTLHLYRSSGALTDVKYIGFSRLFAMTGLRSLCLIGVAASEEDIRTLSSLQQLESLTLDIFPRNI